MNKDIEILEKLKDEQYDKKTLKTICMFYDEDFKPYVLSIQEREAIENLIKENKKLKEAFNNCFDECTSLRENFHNQLEINKNSIPKSKLKEIIDKIDVEDYYCLNEAEEDLRKLVEGE